MTHSICFQAKKIVSLISHLIVHIIIKQATFSKSTIIQKHDNEWYPPILQTQIKKLRILHSNTNPALKSPSFPLRPSSTVGKCGKTYCWDERLLLLQHDGMACWYHEHRRRTAVWTCADFLRMHESNSRNTQLCVEINATSALTLIAVSYPKAESYTEGLSTLIFFTPHCCSSCDKNNN